METYVEMKQRQQREFTELPIVFAYNQNQLEEGKVKLGVKSDKELYRVCIGGYMKKSDTHLYHEFLDRTYKELMDSVYSSEDFAYEMFYWELANHEYGITLDWSSSIAACGFSEEEVYKNEYLLGILKKASTDLLVEASER